MNVSESQAPCECARPLAGSEVLWGLAAWMLPSSSIGRVSNLGTADGAFELLAH